MENVDSALIDIAIKDDLRIRKVYKTHRNLDEKINRFAGRQYLSEQEQAEVATLKRKKLHYKDMLTQLLKDFRFSKKTKN